MSSRQPQNPTDQPLLHLAYVNRELQIWLEKWETRFNTIHSQTVQARLDSLLVQLKVAQRVCRNAPDYAEVQSDKDLFIWSQYNINAADLLADLFLNLRQDVSTMVAAFVAWQSRCEKLRVLYNDRLLGPDYHGTEGVVKTIKSLGRVAMDGDEDRFWGVIADRYKNVKEQQALLLTLYKYFIDLLEKVKQLCKEWSKNPRT